jgi:hypothetical protein
MSTKRVILIDADGSWKTSTFEKLKKSKAIDFIDAFPTFTSRVQVTMNYVFHDRLSSIIYSS